ncbi:hypothetical protein Tco_0974204 [Tanacetum coccineum]|uniref:Uncharacterized protein n=1 Tax=Tanacetum coccineum TaxID=301880 RepID=A0ABQ5EB29_9ASTR
MKATYYPDVGLEQMVPDQMWIEEECKYDIASIVVKIEVFSLYGYDYMKKIVLRRADFKEHVIAKRDFKYLYSSDFEDLYLLNLQEDFQLGIESYQTQLNLTKPRWDATSFEYKHDFTIIESPRSVTFRDKYGVQMIMRFNKIHKFSDGTLHQIDEALDYRVKEFKVNKMNPAIKFLNRNSGDTLNPYKGHDVEPVKDKAQDDLLNKDKESDDVKDVLKNVVKDVVSDVVMKQVVANQKRRRRTELPKLE